MENNQLMKEWLIAIDQYLLAMIDQLPSHQEKLKSAMKHVVNGGGKRLRPMLLLASAQISGASPNDVLPAACALEMIHTYSLIHDDLPGMDDDSMRRGKPTIHVLYDEATAILAGDAFLTLAFEVICQTKAVSSSNIVKMVQLLSQASGASGMIAGQMLDIDSEEMILTLEELQRIHQEKTGKLILVAIQMGCVAGNASEATNKVLEDFANHYGLAFQIQNDLGADIIMSFDECPPYPCTHDYMKKSVERTIRWAKRGQAAHNRDDQALFGIVQGGEYEDLRELSAKELVKLDFPGYSIGGTSVGEPKEVMYKMIDNAIKWLPEDKPRYLMGVGNPIDLIEGAIRGVDMFDCVLPTRVARHGALMTHHGRMNINNEKFSN